MQSFNFLITYMGNYVNFLMMMTNDKYLFNVIYYTYPNDEIYFHRPKQTYRSYQKLLWGVFSFG